MYLAIKPTIIRYQSINQCSPQCCNRQNVKFMGNDKTSHQHLKSKEEIQKIISETQKDLIGRDDYHRAFFLCSMVIDCIDNIDYLARYWQFLWSDIKKNLSNAEPILTAILLSDESQNKDVEDLVKEMRSALQSNNPNNTDYIGSQTPNYSNTIKNGWTKQQFVEHITKVVSDKQFKTSKLKPAEVRNLERLFAISAEQVKNMDKSTYKELAQKYHPDHNDDGDSSLFVILNALYDGKSFVKFC